MRHPFLLLSIASAAGIFAGSQISNLSFSALVLLLLFLFVGAALSYRLERYRITAASLLLLFGAQGASLFYLDQRALPENHLMCLFEEGLLDSSESAFLTGTLYRPPVRQIMKSYVYLETEEIEVNGVPHQCRGRVRVSVYGRHFDEISVAQGDRVRIFTRLRRPRNMNNPGGYDHREFLERQGIYFLGSLKSSLLLNQARIGGRRPLLVRLRNAIESKLERLFQEGEGLSQPGAVMKALILGDRGRMTARTERQLQDAGLYHILAISGLHVGILSYLLFLLFRWIGLGRRWTAAATLFVLLIYLLLVQYRASVGRATLMATMVLLGRILFRQVSWLNTLGVAAFLILAVTPSALFDLGFQLSFLATLSILLTYRVLYRWLAFAPGRMGQLLALSLGAQIGVLPLIAFHFHRVTLAAPLLNLLAIPLVGLVLAAGFLLLFLDFLWHSLASLMAPFLSLLVEFLLRLGEWGASIPFGSYRVPTPPIAMVIGYYALFLLLVLPGSNRWTKRAIGGAFSVLFLLLISSPFSPGLIQDLTITLIDVAQGQAVLVEFPDQTRALYDGGGFFGSPFDVGEEVLSPFLWKKRIRALDAVFVSHAHPDHVKGLFAILNNFRVGELVLGAVPTKTELRRTLLREAQALRVPVRFVHAGDEWSVGPVNVLVVNPHRVDPVSKNNLNDSSLCLFLRYGAARVLLTGDVEKKGERRMVERYGEALQSQVFTVPHHGSRTSSGGAFLDKVKPEVGLLSVGHQNTYGFPHEEVVDRLLGREVALYRTDRHGAVTVRLGPDGRYDVEPLLNPANTAHRFCAR